MTTKILAAFVFLSLNAYVYWYMGTAEVRPPRTEFTSFPDRLGDWQCYQRETLDDPIIKNLRVTDYLSCFFLNTKKSEGVHLYVGYHESQTRDPNSGKAAVIHPPEHCLPGSGWDVIDSKLVPIEVGGHRGEAKRFVIAKGNLRSLVYFWYQSRGRIIARNHEKIFWMFVDRARTGRTDGSLVRFTVPVLNGDFEAAEAAYMDFAHRAVPLLSEFVPD